MREFESGAVYRIVKHWCHLCIWLAAHCYGGEEGGGQQPAGGEGQAGPVIPQLVPAYPPSTHLLSVQTTQALPLGEYADIFVSVVTVPTRAGKTSKAEFSFKGLLNIFNSQSQPSPKL